MSRKRQRIDSATGAVGVMLASGRSIEPPSNVPLGPEDGPFFASVIAEFARSEWSAHQLELAAMLAKKMRMLRDNLHRLDTEGLTSVTSNGSPCQNPLLGGVRMLDASIMATRRSLSLHARARDGEARDVGKRRAMAKEIEAGNPLDDDLIARPN
jgi:hypothetical protein